MSAKPVLYKADLTGPSDPDDLPFWQFWLRFKVENWLALNERHHHYVNLYHIPNTNRARVVLNDRTTAILLKLAMD